MHSLTQEIRLTLRQLWKAPGFSLTVILMLALGIGTATATFSLVQGILLRPLPFHDPGRLVLLGDRLAPGLNTPVTAREVGTYSKASSAFSSMGGYIMVSYELSGSATPEQVPGARLTAGVFPTLDVPPVIGRTFTQQEEDAHLPLAVISYPLWLNRYHRDPQVIGNSIVLDRKPYTIVGVMPRDFEFPPQNGRLDQPQVWVPMSLSPDELSADHAGFWGYHIVARLKDGVTFEQAAGDADRVAQQIMREFPPSMSALRIRGEVTPLLDYAVANVRPLLRDLLLATLVVLLVACANVAGLLLVRAIRRRREYAVRLALGASSSVIIREAILEGLLLSVAGGLLGLAAAAAAIRAALHVLPDSMPRINSVSIDATVASFAVALALLSGILCSLAPAFAALRTDPMQNLKEGARSGDGASHAWLRSALVVAEVGIALVLLTISGAFLRSFQKMRAVDPGFRPDHVLVAGCKLPLEQYSTHTAVNTFSREVVDRLLRKPGITAVGISNVVPASGLFARAAYTIEGEPTEKWTLKFAPFALTYGDYFQVMGIPMLDGRTFTAQDNNNAPPVVIVNQSMARHSWPGQSALGKRLHIGNPQNKSPWATVVGVVADTKTGSRDEPDSDQLYFPMQQPVTLYGPDYKDKLTDAAGGWITLRSGLPPEQMVRTLRATVAEVDPMLGLQQVKSMNEVMAGTEAPRRFNTGLITFFAAGALLLAITGIYAVVAFSVSLRSYEIAIRMALGARRTGIARLVLVWGGKLALLGCVLGVLGSWAASRLVSSFLFEVSATDPLIYAAGVAIMIVMALVASAIPARRAASTEPVEVLRAG
jgi:predicted permease